MRSSVCCFLPQSSPCQARLELSLHFLKGLSQSQSCQEHTAVYTIWLQAAGAAHVPSCLESDKEGSCASPQALLGHPGALPRGEKPELQPTWLPQDIERSSWEGPGLYKPSPLILNHAGQGFGGAFWSPGKRLTLLTLIFTEFFSICQFLYLLSSFSWFILMFIKHLHLARHSDTEEYKSERDITPSL